MKFKLALISTALAALCGCSGLSPSAMRELRAQCETDRGTTWFEPVPDIQRIALLPRIADLATTKGEIVLEGNGNNFFTETDWMNVRHLKRVDQYVTPTESDPAPAHLFGPPRGSPMGMYAFEVKPRGDESCAYNDKVNAERVRLGISPMLNTDECLSYRYIGALNLENYDYIRYVYYDKRADQLGYSRVVWELKRVKGAVVARTVGYSPSCKIGVDSMDEKLFGRPNTQ